LEPHDTTAAWVADARAGSASAWGRLFSRFAPVVHGVLLGLVQPADAEDLTQQVFETALRRLPGLREDAAFPGWILTIARRAALDLGRGSTPLTGLELDGPGFAPAHEVRLDATRALAAIRGLPDAYREPLLLRLVEGLSGPEIAERTGLTPGSVRVNLHRGMALLRLSLGLSKGGEEP
jgi:RNA polymerase sigma-70 factor (ECF subfamily)